MTPHEEIRHLLQREHAAQSARWGSVGGLHQMDDYLEKMRAQFGPHIVLDEYHREVSQRICELKTQPAAKTSFRIPEKIRQRPSWQRWIKNLEERAMITNHEDQGGTHIGQWLGRAIDRWRNAPAKTVVTLEDPVCLEKTKHVRRPASESWVGDPNVQQFLRKVPAETMGELYSRTGISRDFILHSAKEQVAAFVAAHEGDDIREPVLRGRDASLDIQFPGELAKATTVNAVLVG